MAILLRCPSCRTDQSIKNRICMKCGKNLSREREYIVVIKMPGGKWIKRVCGSNLDVAKAIEAKIKTEIREGKFIDKKKPAPTLDEVWEKYLEWAKVNKKTWKHDFYNYHCHIKPRFGALPLDKITCFEVERMILELRKGINKRGVPFAAQTIKHQVVLIRRLFNLAMVWELYSGENPATGKKVKMPKVDNVVTEMLTEQELKRLLSTLENYHDLQTANLVKFALFTGLRRGEIFNLKWEDVDLENGWVNIKDSKGGKSQVIPLNKLALEVLRKHPQTEGSPYISPRRNGKKRKGLKTAWKTIKKLANLPSNFRFHGLRHRYGNFLASSGEVDLYTL